MCRDKGSTEAGRLVIFPAELHIVFEDLGFAVAHPPVDERNTDDDAADQADRGDTNRQVRTIGEAEFDHHVTHTGGGAVTALETDLD